MKANYFWQFKPLIGIEVTDDNFQEEDLIFKDTTLFSMQHLYEMIPELSKSSKDRKQLGVPYEIIKILENKKSHSFIGVKRNSDMMQPEKMNKQFLSADNRIYQICTLLEIALLYKSDNWCTCALVEQIFISEKINTFFKFSHPGMGISGSRLQLSQVNQPPKKISFSELKTLFSEEYLCPLFKHFTTQIRKSKKSLHNALLNSAMFLVRAIHSPDLSNKISFSVTALELLFRSEKNNNFKIIKNRIKTFIGDDAFNFYKCDEVFDARHKFVHDGADAESIMLPFLATGLSLLCVMQFAHALDNFKCKEEFICYLDTFKNLLRLVEYDPNFKIHNKKHEYFNIKFNIFKDPTNFEIPNIFMNLKIT